jgi:hypothetical protein
MKGNIKVWMKIVYEYENIIRYWKIKSITIVEWKTFINWTYESMNWYNAIEENERYREPTKEEIITFYI